MHYSQSSWFTSIYNGLSIWFLIHSSLSATCVLLHLHLSYFCVNLYVLSRFSKSFYHKKIPIFQKTLSLETKAAAIDLFQMVQIKASKPKKKKKNILEILSAKGKSKWNLKDLLACHYCFDEAFNKFYDIDTLNWKGNVLLIIWSFICCRKHFVVTPYPSVETSTGSHPTWFHLSSPPEYQVNVPHCFGTTCSN